MIGPGSDKNHLAEDKQLLIDDIGKILVVVQGNQN